MQSFSLKCHPPGATVLPSTFFILSRGNNAGRPAFTPNPNCFAFRCAESDLDRYYWLVYALWETGHFRPYIFGTAIPMIRIGDVAHVIREGLTKSGAVENALGTLQQLRTVEAHIKKQLALIKDCRRALFWKINRAESAPPAPPAQA